jgi:hypothetical protein
MEFRRATLDEQPDPWLVERHEREIFPLLHRRGWFAGADAFRLYDFAAEGGGIDENVFAYSNGSGPTRSLVVYHNRFGSTAGRIRDSVAYTVKADDGSKSMQRSTLVDALGLGWAADDMLVAFRDASGARLEYLRTVGELRGGLWLQLDAYARHVFWEFREVPDATGVWRRVHDRLGGRGAMSLEDALREQELEPVHAALRPALAPEAQPAVVEGLVRTIAGATSTSAGPIDEVVAIIARRREAIRELGAATAGPAPARLAARHPLHLVRAAFGDPWHLAVLRTWSLLEPLGRLAAGAPVGLTSRAWFDELRLAPVVAVSLRDQGIDEGAAWSAVERVRALLAVPRASSVGGRNAVERAARLADAWLTGADTRALLRVNRWQDVEWLDRDAWRELVDWTLLLDAIDLYADPSVEPPARGRRLHATADLAVTFAETADRAGYRVDAVRELLAPVPRPKAVRPRR